MERAGCRTQHGTKHKGYFMDSLQASLLRASVTLHMEPPGLKGHSLLQQFHNSLLRDKRDLEV